MKCDKFTCFSQSRRNVKQVYLVQIPSILDRDARSRVDVDTVFGLFLALFLWQLALLNILWFQFYVAII